MLRLEDECDEGRSRLTCAVVVEKLRPVTPATSVTLMMSFGDEVSPLCGDIIS